MSGSDPAASSAPRRPSRRGRPVRRRSAGTPTWSRWESCAGAGALVRGLAHRGPAGGEPVQHLAVLRVLVIGFWLVFGVAGLFAFSQAAFAGLGAYTAAWVTGNDHPFELAAVVAVLVCAVVALAFGLLVRRAQHLLLRHRHAGPGRGPAAGLPPLDGVHGWRRDHQRRARVAARLGGFRPRPRPAGLLAAARNARPAAGPRQPARAVAGGARGHRGARPPAGGGVSRRCRSCGSACRYWCWAAPSRASRARARPLAGVGVERAVRRRPRPGHLPDADPRRDAVEVRGAARRLVLRLRRERAA